MGGNRNKRWMNLFGKTGLQATVPKSVIRKYGSRKIECLTGFMNREAGYLEWFAHSKKHIIIVRFRQFTLYVGKGESEYEAKKEMMAVGGCVGVSTPKTKDVISFFSWKVEDEQILEFDY